MRKRSPLERAVAVGASIVVGGALTLFGVLNRSVSVDVYVGEVPSSEQSASIFDPGASARHITPESSLAEYGLRVAGDEIEGIFIADGGDGSYLRDVDPLESPGTPMADLVPYSSAFDVTRNDATFSYTLTSGFHTDGTSRFGGLEFSAVHGVCQDESGEFTLTPAPILVYQPDPIPGSLEEAAKLPADGHGWLYSDFDRNGVMESRSRATLQDFEDIAKEHAAERYWRSSHSGTRSISASCDGPRAESEFVPFHSVVRAHRNDWAIPLEYVGVDKLDTPVFAPGFPPPPMESSGN